VWLIKIHRKYQAYGNGTVKIGDTMCSVKFSRPKQQFTEMPREINDESMHLLLANSPYTEAEITAALAEQNITANALVVDNGNAKLYLRGSHITELLEQGLPIKVPSLLFVCFFGWGCVVDLFV
jgi:hypothetical protein